MGLALGGQELKFLTFGAFSGTVFLLTREGKFDKV
jgi:hypothetical protein